MQPSKRGIRVEREEEMHIEDESAHLWAISYSDFLMVLLSFFVIFFSVAPSQKGTIIDAIIASTKSKIDETPVEMKDVGGSGPRKARSPDEVIAVAKDLEGLTLRLDDKTGELAFLLPEDAYPKNSIMLEPKGQALFDELMKRLLPFKDKVDVVFIGHTDDSPVRAKIKLVISNNFDLSSLRASRAIIRAIDLGWPPTSLYSKGAGEFTRNSRTLSVVIQPKEEALKEGKSG